MTMRRRIDPSDGLQALAALQDGVVTREQALGHGLPLASLHRLLREGRWFPMARGLYCLDHRADLAEPRLGRRIDRW
jgi:hypothetical protein